MRNSVKCDLLMCDCVCAFVSLLPLLKSAPDKCVLSISFPVRDMCICVREPAQYETVVLMSIL